MLKRLKTFIDDPRKGILASFVLALIPFCDMFAMVLIVLMLLRRGDRYAQAGFALVAATVAFAYNGYSFSHMLPTLWVAGVVFIPIGVMSILLRELRSLSITLELGIITTLLLVILTWFVYGDAPVAAFLEYLRVHQLDPAVDSGIPVPTLAKMFLILWPMLVGILQVSIILTARWAQSCIYYPGGFRADFHQFRLHKSVALGIVILTIMMQVIRPEDCMLLYQTQPLATLLLLLAGLGLVHWYATFKGLKSFWLGGIYLLIFIVPQVAGLILGVTAIVDSFFNIRQRVIAAKQRGA